MKRSPILPILLIFVICAGVYALATPPFEASDELPHYEMLRYVRDEHRLPVQDPGDRFMPWEQEGSQPPLYYSLAAIVTAPFATTGEVEINRNPHAKLGLPGFTDNRNRVIYDHYPVTSLLNYDEVYAGRLFSIILAVITITGVYATARLLFPNGPVPILAVSVTAFNPMFLFIAASINNDNLVITLNTLTIYSAIQMMRHGFDLKQSTLIAFLVAFATLSKLSGLVMVPIVVLVALWTAYCRRDWRGLTVLGALMLGVWLLVAGWWYVRNLLLYDELFGTGMMLKIAGGRPEPFTVRTLLDEFEGFRISYWGLFGMVNIPVHPLYYHIMDTVIILAIAGCALFLYRSWQIYDWHYKENNHAFAGFVALITVLATGAVSLVNWTAQTYASQGRLLFPFVGASSILLAIGLMELLRMIRGIVQPFAVVKWAVSGFALFAFIVPFRWIMPVYSISPGTVLEEIPVEAVPIYARFEDIELVAYETAFRRFAPGDQVPVTLYWHPMAQSNRDLSLFIHLLDDQGEVIGKVDTYPGGGLLRTSTWSPGRIFVDSYGLAIDNAAAGQSLIRLKVGWWYAPEGEYLEAADNDGRSIEHVILDAGVLIGDEQIEEEQFTEILGVVFGNAIRLKGFYLADQRLTLLWEALQSVADDHIVFVHVLNQPGEIIAQGDAPPVVPTSYWQPGEKFVTVHELIWKGEPQEDVEKLFIGWYRANDYLRLPAEYPNDSYPLVLK